MSSTPAGMPRLAPDLPDMAATPAPGSAASSLPASDSGSSNASPAPPVVAHILFMDIVGYALLPKETKAAAQTALRDRE